jgi:hypothetical protein
MATVTLANLQARARYRANLESTTFVSDAELVTYINASIAEMVDVIVASDPSLLATVTADYAITGASTAVATVAGASVYKVMGLDYKCGNGSTGYETVRKWGMAARNNPNQRSYRVVGANLYIYPTELAPGTYRMWIISQPTALSGASDATEDYNGWLEYVVIDCAIKMKLKEGTDVSALLATKEALRRRIMDVAARDQGEPETVGDVGFGTSHAHWGW